MDERATRMRKHWWWIITVVLHSNKFSYGFNAPEVAAPADLWDIWGMRFPVCQYPDL